jgi:hypothetical protein
VFVLWKATPHSCRQPQSNLLTRAIDSRLLVKMDLKRHLRIRCRRRTRSGQTLTTDIAENQKPRTTLLLDQLKEVAADLLRRPIRAGDGIALKRWQCTSRHAAQKLGAERFATPFS